MSIFKTIYFDKQHDRFAIVIDEQKTLQFIYWHTLKKHGILSLEVGDYLSGSTDKTLNRGPSFSTVYKIQHSDFDHDYLDVIYDQDISLSTFLAQANETHKRYVYINCKFQNFEIERENFAGPVTFLNCEFTHNFRILHSTINGSIWLSNCRFHKHFSLKGSRIQNNVHLESANFSGPGGASFRLLKCRNLYLDLGVKGGNDIFWLNEMELSSELRIGGSFSNELQILGIQDINEASQHNAEIGHIFIGKELYEFENVNKTKVDSLVKIKDYHIKGAIDIQQLHCENIAFKNVHSERINVFHTTTATDFVISECTVSDGVNIDRNTATKPSKNRIENRQPKLNAGIFVTECSIGRHLKVKDNYFEGLLSLSESAVSEISYLENNLYTRASKLDIRKFTSSRLIVFPENFLTYYGASRLLSPKPFSVLLNTSKNELGDQYCSLKNWLSDSGKLEFEDIAYFHMRDAYHSNTLSRFLFGRVFGWGVRLSNIAISSLAIILLFAASFAAINPQLGALKALALSTQSFISSFFGKWGDYPPHSLISNIVTAESIVGVIFITVFVGAYIRKLLR